MKNGLPIITLIFMSGTLITITYLNDKTVSSYKSTIAGYKALAERKDSLYNASTTMYKGHIAFRDSIISRQNVIIRRYAKMADNQIVYLKRANQDAKNRFNAYHLR